MFEGLKDKLNRFSEDASEDIEVEETEDTEAEEAEAVQSVEREAETADVEQEEAEGVVDTEIADAESVATESTETESVDAEATETGEAVDAVDREDEDRSETDPPDSSSESDDEDDDGRSLTERAKLFATGKTVIDEDDLDSHLHDLEFGLLGSDVELEVTEEILDGVEENLVGETRRRLSSTGDMVRDALREALYDVISVGQFDFDQRIQEADKPVVIIFTGVNGVGKTTTIAKLSHYFEQQGLSSVLANGDTFRAGANEQLEQHAENLDKKIISHEQGSDPAAVIYDAVEYAKANDIDVVLGDTAGRLHTDDGLMDQLSKIDRVIDPDMTIFVDESVAGQDAVNRAREFNNAASIDGTILTKADADTQGGAAISISHVTGKPILFLGTGQDYGDIERFEPEEIVDALLG